MSLRDVFCRHPLDSAPDLLGWCLVKGDCRARIVEVEAYSHAEDLGSHASARETPRNAQMFRLPGTAYVYFTYGTHWMLNVVSHEVGMPGALLIRAAIPLNGKEAMFANRPKAKTERDLLSGPAKLCAAFQIDGRASGLDLLSPSSELRLEPGEPVQRVIQTPRIGLAAGKGDELPWRFLDADALEWVSRKPKRERPEP